MTEKRFTYNVNKHTIECDGKFVAYVNSVDGIRIANKLSVLSHENEQLQSEVSKLTDLLASEIEKNAKLLQENNSLKIENMRFKEEIKDLNDVLARYEEKELKE